MNFRKCGSRNYRRSARDAIIIDGPTKNKISISKPQGWSFFGLKIKPKNRLYHVYPFATDRREKINELQAMIFDEESANEAQKILAPSKNLFIDFTPIFFLKNKSPKHVCRRPKMKCRESSETRFGKVSRQSEPCSRGKRPFEISKKIEIHKLPFEKVAS